MYFRKALEIQFTILIHLYTNCIKKKESGTTNHVSRLGPMGGSELFILNDFPCGDGFGLLIG